MSTRAGIVAHDALCTLPEPHGCHVKEAIARIEAEAMTNERTRLIPEFRERSQRARTPFEAKMWAQAMAFVLREPGT